MISPAELDAALRDLERQTRNLRALSRVNPHQFLEDKQELAKAIGDLRILAKGQPAKAAPDLSAFRTGHVAAPNGRPIPVERRRKAA